MRITKGGNVGIGTTAPDALLHVSATSPHIDIGPQGGNRGKIGYHSNDVIIGSTSSTGTTIFKNNISSTDSPQTSGDTRVIFDATGNIVAQSATQNRIVLGSTGNSSNNSSNWVRGNQGYLQFNSASAGYNWEIAGANKMTMDASGKVTFVASSIDLNNSGTYTVTSATKWHNNSWCGSQILDV